MSSELMSSPKPAGESWASKLFQYLGGRGSGSRSSATGPGSARRDPDGVQQVTRRLIADDRYTFILLDEASIEDHEANAAWRALDDRMALVPFGVVPVVQANGQHVSTEVSAFYLDRYAVTNEQFQRFVRAGGYDDLEIWPREIWPGVMKFTDRTGQPGPHDWENGRFPAGKAQHPVVGVSWFEAFAYARWVGKRLPTVAEWQKAGGWPEQLSGGACNRFPWGDVFEPNRANLWMSGLGDTVPVDQFARGGTPNGIYQMSGNVWEWLDDPLDAIPCRPDEVFQTWRPLRRIIGGAFDTYISNEATCQFITGQPELDRRSNIGFRCAVSVDRLRPAPHPDSSPNS
jgi:iron(II)-dependent oxidoreductase